MRHRRANARVNPSATRRRRRGDPAPGRNRPVTDASKQRRDYRYRPDAHAGIASSRRITVRTPRKPCGSTRYAQHAAAQPACAQRLPSAMFTLPTAPCGHCPSRLPAEELRGMHRYRCWPDDRRHGIDWQATLTLPSDARRYALKRQPLQAMATFAERRSRVAGVFTRLPGPTRTHRSRDRQQPPFATAPRAPVHRGRGRGCDGRNPIVTNSRRSSPSNAALAIAVEGPKPDIAEVCPPKRGRSLQYLIADLRLGAPQRVETPLCRHRSQRACRR